MKRIAVLAILWLIPISLLLAPLAFADDDAGVGPGSSVMVGSGSSVAPAPATPPSVTIDPAHPVQTVEDAWSDVKQFGVIWGGMIVLFGIGTFIVKKNDETHWLSKDHYLPIGIGVLGVLGAAINAKFAGGSWAAVLAALMAAVALALQKPTPGKNVDGTPKLKTA